MDYNYKVFEPEEGNLLDIISKDDELNPESQNILNCFEKLEKAMSHNDIVEIHRYLRELSIAINEMDGKLDLISNFEFIPIKSIELTTIIFHTFFPADVPIPPGFSPQLFSDIIHEYIVILNVLQPKNLEISFFLENHILDSILQIVAFDIPDSLLRDIFQFLDTIFDKSPECMNYFLQILKVSNLKESLQSKNMEKSYVPFIQLLFDISKVYQIGVVLENPIDINKEFFDFVLLFLNIGNIEGQELAYNILINLISRNEEAALKFIEESGPLIESVERHLQVENPEELLVKVIYLIGIMCQQNYYLEKFPIHLLIPCLEHPEPKVKMITAYALCNALREKNRGHFSYDDVINIFYKLTFILENDIYQVSQYIAEIIPKIILGCLDPSIFPHLVENNIFGTIARIASIEDYMKSSEVEHFLSVIDRMFQMAASHQLMDLFMAKFEESDCYQIIADFEFEDEIIQQKVNEFFQKYNEIRGQ